MMLIITPVVPAISGPIVGANHWVAIHPFMAVPASAEPVTPAHIQIDATGLVLYFVRAIVRTSCFANAWPRYRVPAR